MNRYRLHRAGSFTLFAMALAGMILLGWVAGRMLHHPDAGVTWSLLTGLVDWVDPVGPAAGQLQPGDRILSIDGVPLQEELLLLNRQAGDTTSFLIARHGESQRVVLRLIRASPAVVLSRLEPLLIALAFWVLGSGVLVFGSTGAQSTLLFLVCQVSSATLTSGALSAFGPPWTAWLFSLLRWWLSPLAIHFHLLFPQPAAPRRARRFLIVLYAVATLASLLETVLPLSVGAPLLYLARRLWLGIGLASVVVLLAQAYRHAASPNARRQVGLVFLGGTIALTPFLFLSLLPDALLHQMVLPYDISFLFLLTIPLAYGYAVLRYRLIRLERFISRGVTYALVITLLGSLYLIVYSGLATMLRSEIRQHPVTNLFIMLVLVVAFQPLHRRLRIIVNRIFYGGWYDYRTAVHELSQMLGQPANSAALAQTLCQEIQRAMQLECACLLLRDGNGNLVASGVVCRTCVAPRLRQVRLSALGALDSYFNGQATPIDAGILRRAMANSAWSEDETQLLACEQARLWLPLPGRDHHVGVLALGSKRGGEPFDITDMEILNVVARQAGVAFENTYLFAELEQRALENERLHRQALSAREEERKRLARELHDQIIQALVGLNYLLSEMRFCPAPEVQDRIADLQQEVRRSLDEVRRICADLRPPALDSLGLASAVRARLRELETYLPFQIAFTVEGDEECNLSEEVALCLFRVLQEAMLNIQKHAAAQQVKVRLHLAPETASLWVTDDGRGFIVPRRLGQLTNDGHFGLMGLSERLDLVHGTLTITSVPDQGTCVEARVPLAMTIDRPDPAPA